MCRILQIILHTHRCTKYRGRKLYNDCDDERAVGRAIVHRFGCNMDDKNGPNASDYSTVTRNIRVMIIITTTRSFKLCYCSYTLSLVKSCCRWSQKKMLNERPINVGGWSDVKITYWQRQRLRLMTTTKVERNRRRNSEVISGKVKKKLAAACRIGGGRWRCQGCVSVRRKGFLWMNRRRPENRQRQAENLLRVENRLWRADKRAVTCGETRRWRAENHCGVKQRIIAACGELAATVTVVATTESARRRRQGGDSKGDGEISQEGGEGGKKESAVGGSGWDEIISRLCSTGTGSFTRSLLLEIWPSLMLYTYKYLEQLGILHM